MDTHRRGFSIEFQAWGYLFLTTNYSFPVILSLMNLGIIRYNYFKAVFARNILDDFYLFGKYEDLGFMIKAQFTGINPTEGTL